MKRETPLFDAWLVRTKVRLESYGIKAKLAEYLTEKYGRTSRSWQRNLASVLSSERVPNAEFVLAVDAWLDRTEKTDGAPRKRPRR